MNKLRNNLDGPGMTKDQYLQQKAEIIAKFGLPTYDNHSPVGEAAIRLNKLLTEYRLSCRQEALQKERDINKNYETISKLKAKEIKPSNILIGELEVNEAYLLGFNDIEKELIKVKFENWNLTNKQVSRKVQGSSTQMVTALLDSPAFKLMQQRVFDKVLTLETNVALLAAVRGGDSKIIQQLAIQFGLLRPEKIELDLNKPLEDPEAIKLLKQLGDRLIDSNQMNDKGSSAA